MLSILRGDFNVWLCDCVTTIVCIKHYNFLMDYARVVLWYVHDKPRFYSPDVGVMLSGVLMTILCAIIHVHTIIESSQFIKVTKRWMKWISCGVDTDTRADVHPKWRMCGICFVGHVCVCYYFDDWRCILRTRWCSWSACLREKFSISFSLLHCTLTTAQRAAV